MRSFRPQQPESLERASTQNGSHAVVRRGRSAVTRRRPALLAAWPALFAAQLFLGVALAAQKATTPAPAPAQPTTHAATRPHAHPRKKLAAAKSAPQPAPAPAPVAPPAPQMPNWPANGKPVEATVVWDSHGLLIQAANSSLDQILDDVSLKIGAKVEGEGEDERIFGTYGPGPAREVITELLDGSGYNILMVGDQGAGTPRRIVLSGRPAKPAQPPGHANPAASSDNDSENDQEAEQRPSEPNPPEPAPPPEGAAAPGVPVRTPQQMMEERQRQMQQMQQPPQNNPPDSQN